MEPPRSIMDVQILTRRVAALGRFISKSGDKCLPFFKALKKVKDFSWTNESQEAFEELKKKMVQALLLVKPVLNETLYLYLAISENALSAVLVKEDLKVQKPVYYVSKILHGAELNYSNIGKFALALVMALRILCSYLQAHKIEVIELGEFDIRYKPRTAIKAQALADFVVECTIDNQEVRGQVDEKDTTQGEGGEKKIENKVFWILYFDGASKTNLSGAGLVLQNPDRFLIKYAMKLDFPTTNNEAEYEALIASLGLARILRVKNSEVCQD
ncbi:uncharacterized protein LOC141695406 [Apium graveolens]|uniref:uncharacterized protein LOC141695406 n=1 Tax=Apium graveolens TaxID=4045 RepID=UPI003D7A9D1A